MVDPPMSRSLRSTRNISWLATSLYIWKVQVGKSFKYDTETKSTLKRYFHATGNLRSVEKDYYEILGIPRDASRDDVKKAFHSLAKKYHPDANKNNSAAKRKFQEIRDAYETLNDPEKRAQYDRGISGRTENVGYASDDATGFRYTYQDFESNGGGFHFRRQDPFSDTFYKIFSEVFESEREVFASDIHVELKLSFAEAARGCTKNVSFKAQILCDSCNGRGHPLNARPLKCATCNGIGRVTVFPFTSTCASCKGSGRVIKDQCVLCKGAGVVEGLKTVNVTVPAGVDSGDTINVPSAGNGGGRGVHPGNLYIKLRVANDPVFVRDGADIYVDTHIDFTQAILGGKVEVPTLYGKTQIKIPRGIQHGYLLALRGKGLPKNVGLVDHGDQYVKFLVRFPVTVNERQRTILEEFAKEESARQGSEFFSGNWWEQLVDRINFQKTGPIIMLSFGIIILIRLIMSKVTS